MGKFEGGGGAGRRPWSRWPPAQDRARGGRLAPWGPHRQAHVAGPALHDLRHQRRHHEEDAGEGPPDPKRRTNGRNVTAASRCGTGRRAKRMLRDVDSVARSSGSGQGGGDRVRSGPFRAHRAAPLPGRGERYIIAPLGLKPGDILMSGRRRISCPATRCRSGTSRWARSCTTWSCSRARAASSAQRGDARPGPGQGRRPREHQAASARSGRSSSTAWPPSARWATWITRTSPSARPGACGGRVRPTVRGTVMNPWTIRWARRGQGKGNHP